MRVEVMRRIGATCGYSKGDRAISLARISRWGDEHETTSEWAAHAVELPVTVAGQARPSGLRQAMAVNRPEGRSDLMWQKGEELEEEAKAREQRVVKMR